MKDFKDHEIIEAVYDADVLVVGNIYTVDHILEMCEYLGIPMSRERALDVIREYKYSIGTDFAKDDLEDMLQNLPQLAEETI